MMRSRLLLLAAVLSASSILVAAPATAAASQKDASAGGAAADQAPAKTHSQQLDELFGELAKSHDATESAGLITAIDRLHLVSGSDTSDLLMSRALQAMEQQDYTVAIKLLDSVVDLRPQWAEAWNKRATARFMNGDTAGAMADIAQTLKRDPRNIGALSGLGAIMFDADKPEEALRAYDRALALAPEYEPLRDAEARVKAVLAGRSL